MAKSTIRTARYSISQTGELYLDQRNGRFDSQGNLLVSSPSSSYSRLKNFCRTRAREIVLIAASLPIVAGAAGAAVYTINTLGKPAEEEPVLKAEQNCRKVYVYEEGKSNSPETQVPEPATGLLLLLGSAAMMKRRR